jgi:hypothetical protein
MTITWRQQIVCFCILLVARILAEDPQLVQDLRNLSNSIATRPPQRSEETPTTIGR